MLICENCGTRCFTATPELFQSCELCGGRLIDKNKQNKEQSKDEK